MVEVTRHQKGNRRFYTVDGDPDVLGLELPNVTTITNVLDKPALVGWAERVGIEAMRNNVEGFLDAPGVQYLDKEQWLDECAANAKGATRRTVDTAAEVGTGIHAAIEEVLKRTSVPNIPVEYQQAMANFAAWYNQSNIKELTLSETMVYSKTYRYGGTLDAIGVTHDDQLILLDWKTSNGLYPETALQLAAYCQAYCEMYMFYPNDVILTAVRLGKDRPEFETKTVSSFSESFSGFLACMGIAAWKKTKALI